MNGCILKETVKGQSKDQAYGSRRIRHDFERETKIGTEGSKAKVNDNKVEKRMCTLGRRERERERERMQP